jgi:CRP-like cAMP-binding protein
MLSYTSRLGGLCCFLYHKQGAQVYTVFSPCCRCYITPRSFLDLLAQYGHLLRASRTEICDKHRRLLDGIAKLSETNTTLDAMRSQLNDLQPLLAEKTAATSTLLQQVSTLLHPKAHIQLEGHCFSLLGSPQTVTPEHLSLL